MTHFTFLVPFALFLVIISTVKVDVAMIEQDMMSPYATIYVYSGRPNPRWALSIEEWKQLNQLIDTLPKLIENNLGPYQFDGGLGYSGFSAHFAIVSSYPDIYYVANQQQTVLSNPGGHDIFNDQHKIIEKWFKDSAKHHGIELPLTF